MRIKLVCSRMVDREGRQQETSYKLANASVRLSIGYHPHLRRPESKWREDVPKAVLCYGVPTMLNMQHYALSPEVRRLIDSIEDNRYR